MTMQHQEQSNWCWSAVSVSVKLFYSPGFPITQCEQANRQFALTTCCGSGATTTCNVPWFLNEALSGLGNLVSWAGGAMPFADVTIQLDASRPIGCRIGWSGGGGHFVAIDGCDSSAPQQPITIKDPIFGTSVLAYSTFASSYQGTGLWTHSYLTKP